MGGPDREYSPQPPRGQYNGSSYEGGYGRPGGDSDRYGGSSRPPYEGRGGFRQSTPSKSLRVFSCPPDVQEDEFKGWLDQNCRDFRILNHNFVKDRDTGVFKG